MVENKYNRKCVYTGRRLGQGNKVFQRFELLPDRSVMNFRGVKRVHIGYTYACTDSTISGKPAIIDAEREDNAEWDAEDALVDAHNSARRAEAKFRQKASPTLKAAVNALKPLCKRLGYSERKSLIEYLIEEARK